MKALRLYGEKDVRMDDIPIPKISEGELLVKINACTICGSDFRNVANGGSGHKMVLPRVMGHEMAASIIEVGARWKEDFAVGEHVVIGGVVPCGACEQCLQGFENQCLDKKGIACEYDGGFAEFMKVPEQSIRSGSVIKVAKDKMRELALSEPLSCAINGQENAQVKLGDVVLVTGCGALGLFHIQLARLNGAKKVIATDFNKQRLQLAKRVGADIVFSPEDVDVTEEILFVTNGLGVSVVIVAAPVPEVVTDALHWVKKRGRINIFGGMPRRNSMASLDLNLIHYNEIKLTGTSDSTPKQFKLAADLIAANRIEVGFMISKEVGLEKAKEMLLAGPEAEYVKIAVCPE